MKGVYREWCGLLVGGAVVDRYRQLPETASFRYGDDPAGRFPRAAFLRINVSDYPLKHRRMQSFHRTPMESEGTVAKTSAMMRYHESELQWRKFTQALLSLKPHTFA